MSFKCDNCGSGNHATYDCPKPAMARFERKPSTLPVPAIKNAPTPRQSAKNSVLEPARWPGGPEICPSVNLPAFQSESDAKAFHEAQGGGSTLGITKIWLCDQCGCWHFLVCPVGDEAVSGPLPDRPDFPFLRDSTIKEMRERADRIVSATAKDGDLPKQNKAAEKPVELPRAKKAQKQDAFF